MRPSRPKGCPYACHNTARLPFTSTMAVTTTTNTPRRKQSPPPGLARPKLIRSYATVMLPDARRRR